MTFDEFAAARLGALLRYATAVAGDAETAKDVVQDVLVRAHARWRRIGKLDRPERYVQRMVLYEYLSRQRRAARRLRLWHRFPVRPAVEPDHAEAYVERSALWQRLMALPAKQRAVLVLRYYEGLDDADIAEVLDCAPGSVRVFRARALAALRITELTMEETR